jgi:hypothetical protein
MKLAAGSDRMAISFTSLDDGNKSGNNFSPNVQLRVSHSLRKPAVPLPNSLSRSSRPLHLYASHVDPICRKTRNSAQFLMNAELKSIQQIISGRSFDVIQFLQYLEPN